MSVELSEKLLSDAAGWDAVKMARAYLASGQVVSSAWSPPLLRGVVRIGEVFFRASLVINAETSMDNLCTCRDAREWGKICPHVVAVGLHWLKDQKKVPASPVTAAPTAKPSAVVAPKSSALRRESGGLPTELCVIFPPNFDQAAARGKIMLVLEARWSGGRVPLNALPKGQAYAFSAADNAIIDQLEKLSGGETPALMQLDVKDFVALLPLLAEHKNLTLGKSSAVTVSRTPFPLPLRATLEANGEIVLSIAGKPAAFVRVGDWVWHNQTLQPLGLPPLAQTIFQAPIRLSRTQVPLFLSQQWPQLEAAGGVEANFKLEDFSLEPQPPRFHLELKGGLSQLTARLQCAYGARIMLLGVTSEDEGIWLPDPSSPTRYSTRDYAAERSAMGRLQRSGFSSVDGQGEVATRRTEQRLEFSGAGVSKVATRMECHA